MHAKEFYQKIRLLPYQRDIAIKNYLEKRPYLSMDGWFSSAKMIESFPKWIKFSLYQQTLWKWMILFLFSIIIYLLILKIHTISSLEAINIYNTF
jgi:hypothetical protein